jgi:hypothetical protein
MSNFNPANKNKLNGILIAFLLYSAALLTTYIFQIAESNEYLRWMPLSLSLEGVLVATFIFPFIIYELSTIKGVPSDFFKLFICNITIISFILFYSAIGNLPDGAVIVCAMILMGPLLLIELLKRSVPIISNGMQILTPHKIELLLITISLVTILASYLYRPETAGFGIDDSHARRMEAREIFEPSSLLSYLLAMTMSGIMPFFAFRSGANKKWTLMAFAILGTLFFFWLTGAKATFVKCLLAYGLSYLARKELLTRMAFYFMSGVIVLWGLIMMEWWVFDGYSYIGDYFLRRIFPVQAVDQIFYLQFLFSNKIIDWSWWTGFANSEISISYYVGEFFVGDINNNSNSNAFISALSEKGLFGYIKACCFVSFILVLYDRLWYSGGNKSYLFLGFLYGILLVEQTYTTAFISSGVALLSLLIFFEKDN